MTVAAPPLDPSTLLDVPEAADVVPFAERTLGNAAWRRRVGIPHYKLSGRVLFCRDELVQWIADHRVEHEGT